jgi:Zn-dependent metalloprotease
MSPFITLLFLTSTAGAPSQPVAVAPIRQGQDTLTVKEAEPGLKAKAKVSSDSAMKAALAKVPGGKVSEAELENEHGKLVYSFDIIAPSKSGVQEVLVDANTGKVVSSKHESAAAEAKEHGAETSPGMTKHDTTTQGAMPKHDTTMMKRDSVK